MEWNAKLDHFCLTITDLPPHENLTKRALASDIAKMFDVLGWFAPVTIKAKILLQGLWEEGLGWDETVPSALEQTWLEWRRELDLLMDKHIARCYHPKDAYKPSLMPQSGPMTKVAPIQFLDWSSVVHSSSRSCYTTVRTSLVLVHRVDGQKIAQLAGRQSSPV